jgi:hypothetical protein
VQQSPIEDEDDDEYEDEIWDSSSCFFMGWEQTSRLNAPFARLAPFAVPPITNHDPPRHRLAPPILSSVICHSPGPLLF